MVEELGQDDQVGLLAGDLVDVPHAVATFSSRASALLCIWISARRNVLIVPPLGRAGPAARPARRSARPRPSRGASRSLNAARLMNCPWPGLARELVAVDDHRAADDHRLGNAGHLDALEQVVVARRVVGLDRDRLLLRGVEDDDVGVAADRDRALARIEAEQLRRVGREQLHHPVQVESAGADAELVQDLEPLLDPGRPVRDLGEVVRAPCPSGP